MIGRTLVAGLMILGWCVTPVRAEQPLIADLNTHLVAITTGFVGVSVTLFGSVEGGGDVIVTVRGPERDTVVRRKERIAGIWLNTTGVTFKSVPGYYKIFANKPVSDIIPGNLRQLNEIGLDSLKLQPYEHYALEEQNNFRAALIRNFQNQDLYSVNPEKVEFRGERLFTTTIKFPSTVPTGAYKINVYLIKKNDIVAALSTPLVISETGIEAEINDFATSHAILYGLIAIISAAMVGWFISLLFRKE